jgi:hypothetical protein
MIIVRVRVSIAVINVAISRPGGSEKRVGGAGSSWRRMRYFYC